MGRDLFTDSTHIKANANKQKYANQIQVVVKQRKNELEKEINAARAELGKEEIEFEEEEETKAQKVSTVDPDSGYYHRDEKEKAFMYLDHRTVDGLNNFIVDAYVTPGNVHDSKPYLSRLDYILRKYKFQTKNVCLDSGYYSWEIMEGLEDKDIFSAIAYRKFNTNKEDKKIKDHEKTRDDKCNDRVNHIKALQAHTSPILMFAQDKIGFEQQIETMKQRAHVLFDFAGVDKNRHKVYQVLDPQDAQLIQAFTEQLDTLYIADGHHRATAAKTVALEKAKGASLDANDSINYFLSVLFLSQQLHILEYNRVVKDYNNHDPSALLDLVSEHFEILSESNRPIKPTNKGEFTMYLDDMWYHLRFKHRDALITKPIELLDVSILQNYILGPILNINHPATDQRIDFLGGIKGIDGLLQRVENDAEVAFALVATSMEELMTISDLRQRMPPKSTWCEPKLLAGLFIHRF